MSLPRTHTCSKSSAINKTVQSSSRTQVVGRESAGLRALPAQGPPSLIHPSIHPSIEKSNEQNINKTITPSINKTSFQKKKKKQYTKTSTNQYNILTAEDWNKDKMLVCLKRKSNTMERSCFTTCAQTKHK